MPQMTPKASEVLAQAMQLSPQERGVVHAISPGCLRSRRFCETWELVTSAASVARERSFCAIRLGVHVADVAPPPRSRNGGEAWAPSGRTMISTSHTCHLSS
jgi:hypothetical protein